MTLALAFKLQAQLGLFQYFNTLQSEVQCIFWLSAHCFYNAGKLLLKKMSKQKKNLKSAALHSLLIPVLEKVG